MALGRSTLLPKTRTYRKNTNHIESLEARRKRRTRQHEVRKKKGEDKTRWGKKK